MKPAETTGHKSELQLRKQSPIKEHGKLLSLLHKDYCQLQTDYSQGGQKSPETQINTQCIQWLNYSKICRKGLKTTYLSSHLVHFMSG